VFFDLEVGLVVEDRVEYVGGFAHCGGDDSGAVLDVVISCPGVDSCAGAGEVATHRPCFGVANGEWEALTVRG